MYVVSSYTANSGANNAAVSSPDPTTYISTYSYQYAATDVSGRGFLGFATVSMVDGRTGNQISTDYEQYFPYIGMVADQSVHDAANNPLSATVNTPQYRSPLGPSSTVSFPYIGTTTVKTWGAGSADASSGSVVKFVTTTTTIDTKGNPTLIETETQPDQGVHQFYYNNVIYTYNEDTTNWCLSLPKSKTVAITLGPNAVTTPGTIAATTNSQARMISYGNDTVNCRVNSETENALETGMSPTTTYSYDTYGNVKEAAVTDDNNNLLRDTTYDFSGSNGVFPTKVTHHDPYSGIDLVTTQQWDLTNDTLTVSTEATSADPTHALATSYTYDPFARKSSETDPDGTSTAWQYSNTVSGCTDVFGQQSAAYYVTQTHSATNGAAGASLKTCYDSYNRPVMSIRYILGDQAVYQDTEYNILGLKGAESQPHTSTSAASVYWTNTHYDELGRPSNIYKEVVNHSFDGNERSQVTYTYNSPNQYAVSQTVQTSNTTDAPASEATVHYYNMAGYTTRVDDAQNQTMYSTDAFGDVIGITDQAQNSTGMGYDSWGHKTSLADPDMGSWKYAYDALGELTCQTDANTQSTILGYDNLGRLRSRLVPAGGTDYCAAGAPVPTGTPSQWTYDTAQYGPGQLESETDNVGFTKTYTYDQYGRPITSDTNVGGADYVMTTGYDQFGRTASVTYPSMPATTNQPPVANAGSAQLTILGNDVILDGSASNDPDNGPVPLTYAWTQQSGPVNVGIDGSRTSQVTFTPSTVGLYTFQLTVGDGQSTNFSVATVTVNPPVPGAPGISPGTSQTGSFTLTWSAVPGVGSYQVYQSTDNVNFTQIQTVQDNGTGTEQASVPGLANGTYYFAYCSLANGSCTSVGASVSGLVTLPPGWPVSTTVTPTSVTYTVKWKTPSGIVTSYVVRGSTQSNFSSYTDHAITGNPPALSWSSSQSTVGTYYYEVQACNQLACSPFGAVATVQVMKIPAAPSFGARPGTISPGGSSTLSWSDLGYTVSTWNLEGISGNVIYSGGNTSYTVSPTFTKPYQLDACNAVGCSSFSTVTVVVSQGNNMLIQTPPTPVTTPAPVPATGSGLTGDIAVPTSQLPMLPSVPQYLMPILETGDSVASVSLRRQDIPRGEGGRSAEHALGGLVAATLKAGEKGGALQQLAALRTKLTRLPPSLLSPTQQVQWQKRWQELQRSLAQARVTLMPSTTSMATASSVPADPEEALERARQAAVFRMRAEDQRSLQDRLADRANYSGTGYRVQDVSSTTTNLTVDYIYDGRENLDAVVNDADPTLVYWQAQSMDEYGHYSGELYGNNVLTTTVYDDGTGAINGTQTGLGGNTSDQSLVYTWDAYGNLATRQDANAGMTETFQYDALNRIQSSTITGSPASPAQLTLSYSATGDIQSKSDVGTVYTPYTGHAHLLHTMTTVDGGSVNYSYDNNGNMLSGAATGTSRVDSRTATWTAQNQPSGISDAGNCMSFAYDPDGTRYSERTASGSLSNGTCSGSGSTTLEIGSGFEVITPDGSSPSYRVMIMAAGKAVAVMNISGTGGPTATYQTSTGASTTNYLNYLHYDSLGNVDTVTDAAGNLISAQSGGKMSYDIFGKRRDPSTWAPLSLAVNDTSTTDWGYTSQQQLDSLGPLQGEGLVHMNGRVYDPTLGRFISADPRVPNAYNSQDLNRFAYVDNNPLNSTDPTGYDGTPIYTDSNGNLSGSLPTSPNQLPTAFISDGNILIGPGGYAGNADGSNTITETNPTGNNYSLNFAGDPTGFGTDLGLIVPTGSNGSPGGTTDAQAEGILDYTQSLAGQLQQRNLASAQDADVAALNFYNPVSIAAQNEAEPMLLHFKEGDYGFTYAANALATTGKPTGVDVKAETAVAIQLYGLNAIIGYAHTHPFQEIYFSGQDGDALKSYISALGTHNITLSVGNTLGQYMILNGKNIKDYELSTGAFPQEIIVNPVNGIKINTIFDPANYSNCCGN
jgi:RHS repeat-associated protein